MFYLGGAMVVCLVLTLDPLISMQVQEKLTPDEYKEFVDLMKALKSKTMKITAVLERIATLFSAPQRFLLLKGYCLNFQAYTRE